MENALQIAATVGMAVALAAVGLSRATYYRRQRPVVAPAIPKKPPARALSALERQEVIAILREPRFADQAPAEVYATLLDEKRYVASERTMYRILAQHREVRERRDQLRHPDAPVPRLVAAAPNQLWSWDITKLHGATTWSYFQLYVILDVYSRCVVGWLVADHESAVLAEKLIRETCARHAIQPGQLTLHADRGSSMKSKPVAFLLSDLGVTKTHSRPHVSDDNPYSEAHFKTLKYRPDFPDSFGCIEDARAFCRDFFRWYNTEHHHGGIALHTPHDVHYGLAAQRTTERAMTLLGAFQAHPERFPAGRPMPPKLDAMAWINQPKDPKDAARMSEVVTRPRPPVPTRAEGTEVALQ
jgi:putative transposase